MRKKSKEEEEKVIDYLSKCNKMTICCKPLKIPDIKFETAFEIVQYIYEKPVEPDNDSLDSEQKQILKKVVQSRMKIFGISLQENEIKIFNGFYDDSNKDVYDWTDYYFRQSIGEWCLNKLRNLKLDKDRRLQGLESIFVKVCESLSECRVGNRYITTQYNDYRFTEEGCLYKGKRYRLKKVDNGMTFRHRREICTLGESCGMGCYHPGQPHYEPITEHKDEIGHPRFFSLMPDYLKKFEFIRGKGLLELRQKVEQKYLYKTNMNALKHHSYDTNEYPDKIYVIKPIVYTLESIE